MAIVTTLQRQATTDVPVRSSAGGSRAPASGGAPSNGAGHRTASGRKRAAAPNLGAVKGSEVTPTKAKSKAPLTEWSNVELLQAFQGGNDPAFAELYRRHKSELFTYCLRMMSGDEDAASDMFQEIFIRAYEKADQFRDGTNVTGWLFMIARNMCLNAHRTKRPVERIEFHPMLASSDRSLAPEYNEEQHSLREKLEAALSQLPVDFREAFMLREFDGFSYSEIATMTGTTLGMTKIRIYRAKQRMRELLAPYLAE